MIRESFIAAFLGVLLLTGCDRRERFAAPDSAGTIREEPGQRAAYLSVSDLNPDSGATIVVAGSVGVGDSLTVGSFRVRLAYDARRLVFIDEVALPGMMRVVNPQPGEVTVAGAASSPSDGRLFAVRFRVADPTGMQTLLLHVDELNDAEFSSQTRGLTRSSRLVLDRSLAAGKVVPR